MGSSLGAMSGLFPRQGEQILEVLQVLQERPQVTVDRCNAALGQGKEVVAAGFGHGLPVSGPRLVGGAKSESRRAHQPGAALECCQRAVANGKEERLVADVDAAVDGEPAATAQEVGVGSQQLGKTGETIGRSHSCSMYSIVEPSKATNAPFTQRPWSSNHWLPRRSPV